MCLLDESLILLFSRGGILEMSTWNMGAGYVHLNGTFHRDIFGYYTVGLIIVYLNFATHGDEYCLT